MIGTAFTFVATHYWLSLAGAFAVAIIGGLIKGTGEAQREREEGSRTAGVLIIAGKAIGWTGIAVGVLLGLVLPLKLIGCMAKTI